MLLAAGAGVLLSLGYAFSVSVQPNHTASTIEVAALNIPAVNNEPANPKGYPGRWRKARATVSDEQLAEIKQLEAIGYVSGSIEARSTRGVTIHDVDKAQPGYNFYSSGDIAGAVLMDMAGQPIHRWEFLFREAFPNASRADRTSHGAHHWRRAILLDDGSVIAIFGGLGIIKVDRDSSLIWANSSRAHHDAQILPNGDILTLSRISHMIPRVNKRSPIAEDLIVLLDSDGNEKQSWSVLEAVERWKGPQIWSPKQQKSGDIFHTNAIEQLQQDYTDRHPEFTTGRVLTSMRSLNALALIDLEKNEVVWAHTGKFRGQHDPRILDNGNILFFDNGGRKNSSGVFELNPNTKQNEWRYIGTNEHPFFSKYCGTVTRLPNGNTLVTESDNGRSFELSPNKTIVWEFHNPAQAGDNDEFIAALFEVERLSLDTQLDWLEAKP
jgi:hypothetical protein